MQTLFHKSLFTPYSYVSFIVLKVLPGTSTWYWRSHLTIPNMVHILPSLTVVNSWPGNWRDEGSENLEVKSEICWKADRKSCVIYSYLGMQSPHCGHSQDIGFITIMCFALLFKNKYIALAAFFYMFANVHLLTFAHRLISHHHHIFDGLLEVNTLTWLVI